MALLLISCGEKKKNTDEATNPNLTEQKASARLKLGPEKLGWAAQQRVNNASCRLTSGCVQRQNGRYAL